MEELKNLDIDSSYYSEGKNVLKEFYNPVLACAKEYSRITGFFSSKAFSVASKGIGKLILNEGKIKLITGFFTNKDEILIAEEVLKNSSLFIEELNKRIEEFENIEDAFEKESLKAFAWLLANKRLEIKIALPKRAYIKQYGAIFHQKIGIIEDSKRNSISFSGSINETASAWSDNIENFKVFRSWIKQEEKYLEEDRMEFNRLWNNISERVLVMSLNEAIKEKIIKFAPKKKEEINFSLLEKGEAELVEESEIKEKIPPLRNYQEDAISSWESKDYKGIIEMATGTGKTIVGIKALDIFLKTRGISIIFAPTIEICNQWKKDIKKFLKFDELILINSKNKSWKRDLESSIHNFSNNRLKNILIISTYESLENLLKIIKKISNATYFILGDEVHSFGSEKRSKFLEEDLSNINSNFRLGLSATPKRLFDDEGNEKIEKFFGGTIFNYHIGKAIKDHHLVEYNYHLKPINLSSLEYKKYLELTKKIKKNYHLSKEDDANKYFEIFIHQRAKILKNAEEKLRVFKEIIRDLRIEEKLKFTISFCIDSTQLEEESKILDKERVIYSKVTGYESSEERNNILDSFEKGNIQFILSMKILDEGVNIPKIRNAIILSNSRNPREYVQRRGRVLRKAENKKIAEIYDFLVMPPKEENLDEELFELERKIVKNEILRVFEFAKYAKNWEKTFDNETLTSLITKYKLTEMYNLFLKED